MSTRDPPPSLPWWEKKTNHSQDIRNSSENIHLNAGWDLSSWAGFSWEHWQKEPWQQASPRGSERGKRRSAEGGWPGERGHCHWGSTWSQCTPWHRTPGSGIKVRVEVWGKGGGKRCRDRFSPCQSTCCSWSESYRKWIAKWNGCSSSVHSPAERKSHHLIRKRPESVPCMTHWNQRASPECKLSAPEAAPPQGGGLRNISCHWKPGCILWQQPEPEIPHGWQNLQGAWK